MTNPERLIGKRLVADVRVVSIAPGAPDDEDRVVTLYDTLTGEKATISLGELATMIETRFLLEMTDQ